MNSILVLAAVLGSVSAESLYYMSENTDIDIDAVIADLPTLQSYVDCFLERAPCTSSTESLRKNIQDSVIRACDRCNLQEKQRYAKFLKGLKTRLPHEYTAFRQKYDPRGVHFDTFEAELDKYLDLSTPLLLPYFYL